MSSESSGGAINRRDLLKYAAGSAAVFAAGPVLEACGGASASTPTSASSSGPHTGGTPVRGGHLTVGMPSQGASETIDVRLLGTTTDFSRAVNLYDPLFQAVPGGLAPALATSAEPNADATVWTVKLRDGVTFHNGKPFSADDVVYSIKASWGGKVSYYKSGTDGLIDVKNVRKLDRLTVEVPLLMPNSALPGFSTWYNAYIIPDGTTDFNKGIGTGPFKLESFVPGSSSTFTANESYYRGAPYVDTLVINSTFTDEAARINAVAGNQIDIAPSATWSLAKAQAQTGSVVLGNSPGPAYLPIVMRVNVPPFDDVRVSQAFKLLVNREQILTEVYAGYGTIGNDVPGATFQYWDSAIKSQYDPEKAKSLLKAAGHEDLTLPLYTADYRAGMVELATVFSAQAAAIGLKLPVTQLPSSTYFSTARPGYLTNQRLLSVTAWDVMPAGLPALYLLSTNKNAVYDETGWGMVPGQDVLYNKAIGQTNVAKATPLWHAMEEQQAEEGGWVIPVNYNYVDVYAPNVRGVQTNGAGQCGNFDFHRGWLAS